MHILMVAAENAALPGAKVGGVADVVRDVPRALAQAGHEVTVLIPAYQQLSHLPQARLLHTLTVEFARALETLELHELRMPQEPAGVRLLTLDHPLFGACGAGQIYCHDLEEPFATDAVKFALFCQGVAYALASGALGSVDLIHAHDWHAATLLLLRRFHRAYGALRRLPTVFTIHNLSLQGIRPLRNSWSSPERWFADMKLDTALVADPRWPDCLNLMRAGINLADQVHVVSPTYAAEIIEPSDPAFGLVRGEGLQHDLARLSAQGRLHGILNGCEYPPELLGAPTPGKVQLADQAEAALASWVGDRASIKASWFHAQRRLQAWRERAPPDGFVVSSVGRLTPQKIGLLMLELDGKSVLDHLLEQLGDGLMLVLGSGDAACEQFMMEAMCRHDNLLFFCGYAEALGESLYRYGDLFLMPSVFEPCGISQMLAMRAGTPCLVHGVGGLADTVRHFDNGFVFKGGDSAAQGAALLAVFRQARQVYRDAPQQWQTLCRAAAAARFTWARAVQDYERQLYGLRGVATAAHSSHSRSSRAISAMEELGPQEPAG